MTIASLGRVAVVCALCSLLSGCPDAEQTSVPGQGAPAPDKAPASATGPNVLLVTIDTLRADHLPAYGYAQGSTPHLDRLASEGIVFEQCNAHAPITLPSHTSILTGLYPPEHGVRSNGTSYADAALRTLPEIYQSHGYATAAFVSAFVLDSRFGLEQGFGHYDDDLEDGRQRWSVFGVKDRRAAGTVDRLMAWLETHKQQKPARPFFVWLHLYDPHFEYDPPEPFRSLHAHPYDGEIAYTDHQLGRLFDKLQRRGLDEDTLIAVTSDHGESLGEHGESTHSLFVYEATQHVPLILRLPKAEHAGKRIEPLVRHVDLAPTLVDLSGLAERESEWLSERSGKSLRSALSGGVLPERSSYAEAYLPKEQFGWAPLYAVRDGAHKYIEAPRAEFYNLAQDPHELQNLLPHATQETAALKKALTELRTRPRWESAATTRSLDAESRAKLKALGYVKDDSPDPAQAGADPKDMAAIYEGRERIHQGMNDGRYAEAVPALERLLKQDPTNAGLHADLAACLAELGQWREAEAAYTKLAKLQPDSVAAHTGLSKVAFKGRRDFARATKELEAALALAPHDPSLYGLKGDLLHEQGKLDEALKAYKKAIDGGDQTPSYFVGYASALNLTGQLKQARDVIERAILMEQSNAVAHHNHGVILERMGLWAAASGAYDEATTLEPTLVPSVSALSKLLIQRGRAGQALAVLQQGLRASPDQPALLTDLGALQMGVGQQEQAIASLERAVKVAPRNAAAHTHLGSAYEAEGRFDDALSQYQAAQKSWPANSAEACSAHVRLGRVLARQGRNEEARGVLDAAIQCGGEAVRLRLQSEPLLRAVLQPS